MYTVVVVPSLAKDTGIAVLLTLYDVIELIEPK